MSQNNDVIDILLVESQPIMKMVFEEISKLFNLTIVYANNIKEFIELVTKLQFRNILCDLHIEYNFGGLLISRMYEKIRKINSDSGSMFFFSLQNNPNFELAKLVLDDLSEEKFGNFYDFLQEKFPDQFFHFFSTDQFKQAIHA